MSSIEIKRRNRAVKIEDAISGINGVPVSDFAMKLSQKWAEGTVSDTQMIEKIIESHKQKL